MSVARGLLHAGGTAARAAPVAPVCPIEPRHGNLLALRRSGRWFCLHAEHGGRPKSHPAGATSSTRHLFTDRGLSPDSGPVVNALEAAS